MFESGEFTILGIGTTLVGLSFGTGAETLWRRSYAQRMALACELGEAMIRSHSSSIKPSLLASACLEGTSTDNSV